MDTGTGNPAVNTGDVDDTLAQETVDKQENDVWVDIYLVNIYTKLFHYVCWWNMEGGGEGGRCPYM